MTTMISDLPRDIAKEILSRLPLKSMRSVRLTCKKWNALSKSRRFSKMQIDKEELATKEGECQMIMTKHNNLYLISVVNNGDPYTEVKGKLTCLTEDVNVSQVYNCEGLLLCICREDKITKLMVWNPYCLKTRWMDIRCSYPELRGLDTCRYALGYAKRKKTNNNKSCRLSHKILRFVNQESFWCEIYNFESDSWKTLDITPHWSIELYSLGVSVKGNTYWPATKGYGGDIYIICFDFTNERFGQLMIPPFASRDIYEVNLSCVKEEKLAAFIQGLNFKGSSFYEVEIWITTKIETGKMSWSKFFTVNYGTDFSWRHESFIIDEEKKLAIGFNDTIIVIGESGYYRELALFEESGEDDDWRGYLCAYVPSLVQIKQAARDKRIKQNSAEKRRCDDEKMLRLDDAREKRIKKQSA